MFADLENNSQILKITVPIFTPVTKNPDDETEEQIKMRHQKFLALPELVKDKLACVEISEKIQQIGIFFKLELLQMADISRAIRSYYFGELKLEDMPFVLAKEMNVDLTTAKEITQTIINKIINDHSQEEAYVFSLENLIIPEALKKYPGIAEQLITSNSIKIQKFSEMVKPSLKNWITDYLFVLGQGAHNGIERSNYLFHSKNTVSLSSPDRQKLAYTLKCLDENIPVSINKTAKQIVFPSQAISDPPTGEASKQPARNATHNVAGGQATIPRFIAPQPVTPQSIAPQNEAAPKTELKNNIQSVDFSYPQKMTYEKRPLPSASIPPKNTQTNLGPNVVNLKD
jgi:hypothetical protein